jgi:hypothetical protein
MSDPSISSDTRSATFSLVSADGRLLSSLQVFQIARRYGLDPARASLSARQAKGAGKLTSGTYGPRGSGSSASVALQLCLENRLRVQLGGSGSTLYRLTWKQRATPAGRPICALRASAPRTSDSASIGWPSPVVNDAKGSDYTYANGDHNRPSLKLGGAAKTAAWATPAAHEAGGTPEQFLKRKEALQGACGISLTSLALQASTVAAWPTPNAMPPNRGGLQSNPEKARERRAQGHMLNLDDAACLAAWPTPTARDHKDGASEETAPVNALLGRQVWTVRGPTLTGSVATIRTVKDGARLNPALSRWLQGYPTAWCQAAIRASRTLSTRRKR